VEPVPVPISADIGIDEMAVSLFATTAKSGKIERRAVTRLFSLAAGALATAGPWRPFAVAP
jgi:hypothetical protein